MRLRSDACWRSAGLVRTEDPQQLALYVWAQSHGIAMLALTGPLPSRTRRDVARAVCQRPPANAASPPELTRG